MLYFQVKHKVQDMAIQLQNRWDRVDAQQRCYYNCLQCYTSSMCDVYL